VLEDTRHRTPEQAWHRARVRAGLPATTLSPITIRPSMTRAHIYACLLTAPTRWWTVNDIARSIISKEHISDLAIRETVYVLIGDGVMERVPHYSVLTTRLTIEGAILLRMLLWAWSLDRR
jgi:hypothetical protein